MAVSRRKTKLANTLVSEILASPIGGSEVARARKFKDLRITGDVDLSQVKLKWPVVIENCSFQDIDLTEACIPELVLRGSSFRKLTARHLEVSRGDLDLQDSAGSIDISGAHVRDDVHLASAKPSGVPCALRADGIHVGGDFSCKPLRERPFICDGFVCNGTLSLDRAEILGSLHLQDARLNGTGRSDQRALSGEQLKVGGEFEAQCLESCGSIYLIGLQVAGELNLAGAQITSSEQDDDDPTGVYLDRCHIGGSLFCDEGFSCVGGLRGIGATIDGSAYFDGATLTSPNSAEQGRSLLLDRAHIRGILSLCRWPNPRQVPINQQGKNLRSYGDTFFTWNPDYLTFACDGVIRLSRLTVDCETRIETGDIHGRWFPSAVKGGSNVPVAVDLNQFRTPMLVLNGGPRSGSEPPRDRARIDLTGATLGILLDYLIDGEDEATVYPTVLKGCTYSLVHQARDQEVRVAWLEKGSTLSRHMKPDLKVCYRSEEPLAQPYQQVADASGRAGNDAYSRAVLWQMNEAVNHTQVPGAAWDKGGRPSRILKRAWSWFQDVAIGYGYRPGLAAMWLLGLWAFGVFTFWLLPPASTSLHPRGMSSVEHITYPLDLIIPLLGFGEQSQWHPVGLYPQALAAALIAFGWIFSITVVAAITRIARRS